MSEQDLGVIPVGDREELSKAWADSIKTIEDAQVLALAGGMNFRIDLAKALVAVWLTAELYLKTVEAATTWTAAPVKLMGIPSKLFAAVVATLDAVREKMNPLVYVACAVLSQAPQGLTKVQLKQKLDDFFADPKSQTLPWYLGVDRTQFHEARGNYEGGEKLDDLIAALHEDKWIENADERMTFKTRHFTLKCYS